VASEHSFYFAEKVFHADRLTLVTVEPFSQHRLPLVRHGRCRDGDDPYSFHCRIRLELLQRRDAVHAWELDVHEDKSGKSLHGELNPLFRCVSLNGLVTLCLKYVAGELAVLVVVLNDEDQFSTYISSTSAILDFRFWILDWNTVEFSLTCSLLWKSIRSPMSF
jgi:hypothetical protein